MKKLVMSFLAVSMLVLWSGQAQARCMIVVGGPFVKPEPRARLTVALEEMFRADSNLEIDVFETENLLEAARLGADFIVYLKGSSIRAEVEFRDILLNKIVWDDSYPTSSGFQSTVDAIRRDMEREVIPLLPSYCRRAE